MMLQRAHLKCGGLNSKGPQQEPLHHLELLNAALLQRANCEAPVASADEHSVAAGCRLVAQRYLCVRGRTRTRKHTAQSKGERSTKRAQL